MDLLRAKVERIVREVIMEILASGEEPSAENSRGRPLIAANWKMNHLSEVTRAFARRLVPPEGADMLICPPAILIPVLREALSGSPVAIGAQNLHHEPKGAFTGEHSAAMIKDAGAGYV
ncbi:MAG: triose-phosphate isomerase, partial [Myxococcota bacterium]